jgi:hypothetical protein
MNKDIHHIKKYIQTRREMRLSAHIGDYDMDEVILDLGSEVNVLTKQTWEIMGRPKLRYSPIQLKLANQQKVCPLGRLSNLPMDIDGVQSLAYFEVIEIIDDRNPFPALLGIDWDFDNLTVINLKNKQMTFEGHNIRIIAPLDPSMGPRYIEPIRAEEEAKEIDDLYKMTMTQDYYINPTADGTLSWRYASSCTFDSEAGLENWQNRMHEISTRRCTHLTKSLHWIGIEVCEVPIFDGLFDIQEFLQDYEAQIPLSQRLKTLDVSL